MPRKSQHLGVIRKAHGEKWDADIRYKNQRLRKRFDSKKEAQAWLNEQTAKLLSGVRVLRADESRDATEALDLLCGKATLVEAARYFNEHAKSKICKSMADAVSEYLETKRTRRADTYTSAKARIGVLPADRFVHEITTHDLTNTLDTRKVGIVSRNNYRRDWGGFFRWAKDKGYCTLNPAEQLQRLTVDDESPDILTVDQAQEVLIAASQRGVASYFALGMFGGLRTEELDRIEWSAIKKKHIDIAGNVAKKHQRRIVEICPALRSWLDLFPGKDMLKIGRRTRDSITRSLSFLWPHNGMRHSFASYHLALHKNAALTAHELGHTNPDLLYRHYREVVTHEDAVRYFDLSPETINLR